jgi:uncharacterized protein (TIGR03435 family)
MNAGRRFRIGLAVVTGMLVVMILTSTLMVHMQPATSARWTEFSLGPAFGDSTNINSNQIRSSGVTLKTALATAHDMPTVRVIGPPWLLDTRYALTAVVGVDASESFRSMLRQELKNRLSLVTHVEPRPFDVFVLRATDTPRLERSHRKTSNTWISYHDAQLQDASMERLASALQSILGKPVIDETGITGSYDLELAWGEDRLASITAAVEKFGLRLSAEKRELEALIVDDVRRDATLVMLAQIGRLTQAAPQQVRRTIAGAFTIR